MAFHSVVRAPLSQRHYSLMSCFPLLLLLAVDLFLKKCLQKKEFSWRRRIKRRGSDFQQVPTKEASAVDRDRLTIALVKVSRRRPEVTFEENLLDGKAERAASNDARAGSPS